MDYHHFSRKVGLLLAGCSVIFITLACSTLSRPTPTPQPEIKATALPNFERTAEYQAAMATQLASTQTALQGEQIQPTLEAIFANQCTFPVVQSSSDAFLQDLNIDLWPEFDRPSMLVIYQATLPSQQTLPVELAFRIPARAGEPNAVAIRDSSGILYTAAYTRTTDGDWATITLTATAPSVQLEYYDPALNQSGNARHYEFQWVSDYSITNLLIRVRPSEKVTSMQITPPMAGPGLASDGTFYFCSLIGPINRNTPLSFTIDYEMKSSP
jgi:hypothetical protein